jgi:hypothetical protein
MPSQYYCGAVSEIQHKKEMHLVTDNSIVKMGAPLEILLDSTLCLRLPDWLVTPEMFNVAAENVRIRF